MWNAPLSNGVSLTVATSCALVLFGLSVGLVIAAVCWTFIAVSADQHAGAPQESYASISGDEIEIVIELVRDAIASITDASPGTQRRREKAANRAPTSR